MSLDHIHCNEPTINCFISCVKKLRKSPIISISEASKGVTINANQTCNKFDFIVLGEVKKVIVTSTESKRMVILMKEILPNHKYGENFKTIIYGDLVIQLLDFGLTNSDKLVFNRPCVRPSLVFQGRHQESSKMQKFNYLLEFCSSTESLLWLAKKETPERNSLLKQSSYSFITRIMSKMEPSIANKPSMLNIKCQSRKEASTIIDVYSETTNTITSTKSSDRVTSEALKVVNAMPASRLLQKRYPTQSLSPRYKYKTLTNIKKDAALGNMERTNLFSVVREVSKPLTLTSTGKFTIICKTVDDSLSIGEIFCLHFFCPDDMIVKQIEQGDVLRLHRVKIEKFGDVADGRIFNSCDVVLFKEQSQQVQPLTIAKTTRFTEDEKERVKILKEWYKTQISLEAKNTIPLEDIYDPGLYAVLCKIVSNPTTEDEKIVLEVADDSKVRQFQISSRKTFIITVYKQQALYLILKADDTVYFPEVKVCNSQSSFSLSITTNMTPYKLDPQSDPANPVFTKVEAIEEGAQEAISEPEINKLDNVDSLDNTNSTILDSIVNRTERDLELTKIEFQQFLPCANSSCLKGHSYKEKREVKTNNKNAGLKGKKTLLTPNYVNLSDAVDEEEMQKRPSSCDTPAIDLAGSSLNHTQVKSSHKAVEERSEKRSLKQAETCLSGRISVDKHKRMRLESETIEELAGRPETELKEGLSVNQLTNNLCDLMSIQEGQDKVEEEAEGRDTNCETIMPPGPSVRLKLYLIKVIPEPSSDPRALVSGYCHTSCHKLFRYSKILWSDQHNVGLCPVCSTAEEERRLELIFMMEWQVMDMLNVRAPVILCREFAQQFLKCSVEEFLNDETLQRACIQLLSEHCMADNGNHPLLDVSVKWFSHKLFLVSIH